MNDAATEKTTTEEKPEKRTYNYKGEMVEIGNLKSDIAIACEAVEVNVPSVMAQWGTTRATKLPKLLVVTSMIPSPYGDKVKYLTWHIYAGRRAFQQQGAYVPADFKLKVLTGVQGKKMLEKYEKHQMENLHQNLAHNFMIGSDPEIFVENKNGDVLPAFAFLGSKKEKKHITHEGKPVYWDGFQAEFETQANTCLAYHIDSVHYGLKKVYERAITKDRDAKLSLKTVMEIPHDLLINSKEEFVEFGCMPSKNAYGLEGKRVPARELPFRSTGGHIHYGIGKKSEETMKEIVKAMDATLAVCCVSLFAKYDNPIRREYYGLVGEYRTPEHGLEYRVLSNAWLCHPMIAHFVCDFSRKCLMFGLKGYRKYWNATEEEVIKTVQNCDVDQAHAIMERNKPMLMKLFRAAYSYLSEKGHERAYNLFYSGVDTAISNPRDIIGNWKLNGGWVTHSGSANATVGNADPKLSTGEKI